MFAKPSVTVLILATWSIAVLSMGCERHQASEGGRPPPAATGPAMGVPASSVITASSATPIAPAESAADSQPSQLTDVLGRAMLQEREAENRVVALPEVRRFVADTRGDAGNPQPILIQENAPANGCTSGTPECRWSFYVGQTDGALRYVWCRFYVDAVSGAIKVWDASLGDELVSYEAWRRASPPQ